MQFCNNFYIYIMYPYTFNFYYLDAYFANNVCDLILIIRKKSFSSYFFVFSRHTSRIMFVFFVYLLFFILSLGFSLIYRSRSELKINISVRSKRKRITSASFASSYHDATRRSYLQSLLEAFQT